MYLISGGGGLEVWGWRGGKDGEEAGSPVGGEGASLAMTLILRRGRRLRKREVFPDAKRQRP